MTAEFELVDVWVGRFSSDGAVEDYVRETYGEDDVPISRFAADMGVHFYDHDFLEHIYHQETADDLAALLQRHSFGKSYALQADAVYRQHSVGAINTTLLLWGKEIEHPRSARGADYELHYLGRFHCDPGS
jgi:hypothetical protein